MKVCTVCGKSEKLVRFEPKRSKCSGCRSRIQKAKRALDDFEKKAILDPLSVAYTERLAVERRQKMSREHAALLEANTQLKKEMEMMGRANLKPVIKHFAPTKASQQDAVPVMVASDWHVEEPVVPEMIQGLNEYNLEIAEQRSQRFYKNGLKLAQIVARDAKVKTIVAPHIGDLFSGSIHEDLVESNLLGPADAANFARGLVISGIEFLLKESDFQIEIPFMDGNHGRMTQKMRIQTRSSNSLELFMMRTIAEQYRNHPRVHCVVANGDMLFTKYFENFKIRWIHGDHIGYQGGIGGVTIPINKKIAAWDRANPASLTVLGHFHQLIHGGNFIVNGSLIGYNSYAQAIGASPEAPRQAFFTVNARNGGEMGMFAPIWLDETK